MRTGADFDGETYSRDRDHFRLTTQMGRVFAAIKDGRWRSLEQISSMADAPAASVSARLRDFRKDKFGGHVVERKCVKGGYWEYRLIVPEPEPQQGKLI